MLINLRNALMTGKRLPYDAEVEYLESTGTQYIDTGITPDTLDLSVELTLLSKGGHVFGCRNSSNLVSGNIWSAYSNNATSMREDWLLSSSTFAISSTVPNTVTFSSTTNGSSISYGGQTYTGNAKTTYSYSMVLFGVSTAGVVSTGKMVIYACKIWNNGVLVRDFIPVRKGTTGYLYDRVTRKLFGNAGTGDFVLGQDVVPVEWVQSTTGSEYISTGVLPSAYLRTKIRASYMYNPIARNSGLFGSRTTASSADRYWINYDGHVEIGYGNYVATSLVLSTGELVDIDFNYIENGEHKFKVNDLVITASGNPTTTVGIILFGRISGTILDRCTARFYYADFIRNGVDVGKFRPVRVGTEGALIDILTRRIYRNAGSGAFTYGNDLKYPIPSE